MLLCKNSNNRQERMRAQKNTFHFLAVFGCALVTVALILLRFMLTVVCRSTLFVIRTHLASPGIRFV